MSRTQPRRSQTHGSTPKIFPWETPGVRSVSRQQPSGRGSRRRKPRLNGPFVFESYEGAPPPTCPHCGGPCALARQARSCDNTERAEDFWCCVNHRCVYRTREVVIQRYALEKYSALR